MDSTKINDVKHQAFAIAVFLVQKTAELIQTSQWRLMKPVRNFACSNCGYFKLAHPRNSCLDLLRPVLQNSIHDRHTGRGVAQGFPFGDQGNELELIQFASFSS